MPVGSFTFVLHSHLPYCRKSGVWPFGEEWVFEAMADTYLPVLDALCDLVDEGIRPRIVIGFTPVLLEQLRDPYMLDRFEQYTSERARAAAADADRFRGRDEGQLERLARMYRDRCEGVLRSFQDRHSRDVVGAFARLQDEGCVEIVTSAATHSYLPLLGRDSSVYAQIKVGVDAYARHFGRPPAGAWLPECGYRPGLLVETGAALAYRRGGIDEFLAKAGINYFFVDTHAVEGGRPVGAYAGRGRVEAAVAPTSGKTTLRPYYVNHGPVAVFGRNERTGLQVWSAEWGYPGDGNYREFHKRDSRSGLQYWRVTSRLADLGAKELYHPEAARSRVDEQSAHFVWLVEQLLQEFRARTGLHGIIVAPYDIELFGHWWFEGVAWLKEVLAKMSRQESVEMTTPGDYLRRHPPDEGIDLPEASWGLGGKHYVWLNPDTEWMWPRVHQAEARMEALADNRREATDDRLVRVMNQAARELLLLQSSDWPFLVTTQQAKEYALRRFGEHLERFNRLAEAAEAREFGDWLLGYLKELEERDRIFPELDFRVFGSGVLQG